MVANTRSRAATAAKFTHFDARGQAHMVDVGAKGETRRVAVACGSIVMRPQTLRRIALGRADKGDVLGVARVAAIQAAKRTPELIPLAHPIALTRVAVEFEIDHARSAVALVATAECRGRTGVEMEALVAASVGLLTVYDMCKALDREMRMEGIQLLEKRGGKSGPWRRARIAAPQTNRGVRRQS